MLLPFTTIAQVNNLDSLERLVETDIPDSTRRDVLYTLAANYTHKNTDKCIRYTKRLIAFSEQTDNQLFIGVGYNLLGTAYLDKDYGLDMVMSAFEKGMQQAEKLENPRLKAFSSNGLAMAYDKFGRKEKALELYYQAYSILYESGDKRSAVRTLGNFALVLKNYGDLEVAKKYYLEAIIIAKEIDDELMVSQLENNLATIYYEQSQIDSALVLYNTALEVNRKANDKYFTALILANIGRIYNRKKQYQIAYDYLTESYKIATDIQDTYCIGTALSMLCDNYYQQKKYAKTIAAANEALKILGENGDVSTRTRFYKHLSKSYEAQGNYKLAFNNQKQFYVFSDSLYNIKKSKQIDDLKIQYEVSQKETENQLLKAEQETVKCQIRNQGYIAFGLIAALLLAIGWGTTFYRSSQQKKKHNEELKTTVAERTADLQKANQDLAKSNEDLEQANYELRTFNYIASHDIKEPIRVIGGYASLIFKRLPNDLKENLGEYFDTIKRSTTQLYTLVEDFAYYSTLSKDEIVKTEPVDLNQLTYNVINSLQESILKYKGEVLIDNLPTINSSNTFLFTALKNLIENGLKYNKSEKPTVEVNYQETENHYQITVSDNGIGIDEEYQEQIFEMFKRLHNRGAYDGSGIGLAIVKLSVEKLGGTVNLESEEGKGSRFIIQLSIK
ncbi:MAG: ATP-binding protein [Saprospiraceae bacterium]